MQVDMNKQYRTRNKGAARIDFIAGDSEYPVRGAIWDEHLEEWLPACWTAEGRFSSNEETAFDLVDVPPQTQAESTETEVTIGIKPKRILKKRDLLTAIASFPDDADIVIQIHDDSIPEGQTGVSEDLYPFFVEHVRVDDNLGEIRLMLLPND